VLVFCRSVSGGLHARVAALFPAFDPQIEVVPAKGKDAPTDDPLLTEIKQLPEVDVATECVEDNALVFYGDKQAMVTIKGVDDNFTQLTRINDLLYGEGEFALRAANLQYGVLGIRLAQQLGTGARWKGFMRVFAPNREGQFDISNPASGFVVDSLLSPGVVFSVRQAKYDQRYILTSVSFARNLFGMQGMLTALELKLKPNANTAGVKKKIQNLVGNKYKVRDRYEQQEDTFRIMNVEKAIAYIFLTFILVVACFNIVGSLSMLIIDKKTDVATLRNLGATDKQIVRIFLFEGRMISAVGALVGVGLGLLLCWLQQQYGLVSLGKSEGSFIVNAYPVSVHYMDVLWIFVTVIAVGWLSVWYPVRYLSRKLLG